MSDLLEKFKELDVPKEIFERNVKKATEKGQEAYIEKVYEVVNSYSGFRCRVNVNSFLLQMFSSNLAPIIIMLICLNVYNP